MSAKKLSLAEADILADLVLRPDSRGIVDTGNGDSRRAHAALVVYGYIECRFAGPAIQARATREGTYRILNPGKL